MPQRDAADFARVLPRLRHDFEQSRRLVAAALRRAARAADAAAASRRVLAARATLPCDGTTPSAQIWRAAAREVVRSTDDRDRSLAIVAHELRQPLAAAIAAHSLIAAPGAGEETRRRAEAVLSRQLLHLSGLVDALLDYARLSVRARAIAAVPVDVNAVAADAVEAAAPLAGDRRHALEFQPCGTAPVVLGDPTRLRQALANLLQNAVRYTPEGGRIGVTVSSHAGEIRVEVRDSGEGFMPDRLDEMFTPFVRLSASGAGLGIGLPLVRKIVELHGGRVTAASGGPGTGSVFTIVLRAADGREIG